ncbi:SDR family NAD(P)-dependent oxidoreductase [Lentzea sp. NPDC051213]|uniref:SDR family NAD(P)-dependent oxidoreductase n=1 Tax=Lentzea sp. NPDC051213 TaxID=3364126 RepID=UPI0037BCC4E8
MSGNDAIAVIGLACRLPGALDAREYWRLLADGRSALLDEAPSGRPAAGRGGYLAGIDLFDHDFFGISPREAAAMDPQQRLVMELSWEALEDAGVVPAELRGSRTGVFAGSIADDYATLVRSGDAVTQHSLTGLQRGIIANRVSYFLGLRGPSMTVDTGQSSSLVAVHLACESLRTGESGIALAAGVQLNLAPASKVVADRFGGLSPDGECFTFDARANGYVRGEGGAVVVLKRLADAVADGDRVLCVIRGSAVNNDGGGTGLTAPEQEAQEAVIRLAHERAGTTPSDTCFVELHGTGTKVGDPVEAGAIGAVIGAGRSEPVLVGSVKTNIGHLEGAAGIAGLAKAVLAISHRRLPASLNHVTPNPAISLESLGIRVNTGLSPLPDKGFVAGVSAFGVGGTNCHVVLSDFELPVEAPVPAERSVTPWLISGREPQAARDQAARLAAHLAEQPDLTPDAVGRSLATRRTRFEHRAVVVGGTRDDLLADLRVLAAGGASAGVVEGAGSCERVAFVFPGQGSQWAGMAVELLDSSPVFAQRMRECDTAIEAYTGFSVIEVLNDAEALSRIEILQPALFAIMVSLAALWESYGVRPSAVVGHSQGEIAAAHVAGVLSLEDAARVVVLRSKLFAEELVGRGAVASVALPLDEVRSRLSSELSIAGINGPRSVTVAGPVAALESFVDSCVLDGHRARLVGSTVASHCAQVEPLRERLLELLAPVSPRAGEVPFYSAVTGTLLDGEELDAGYWFRNAREPVDFVGVVGALLADGHRAFVEASPHPVLAGAVQEIAEHAGADVVAVGSTRRDDGGLVRFTTSVAEAAVRGVEVDWSAAFDAGPGADLPTYAFQRQSHWITVSTDVVAPQVTMAPSAAPVVPARDLRSMLDLVCAHTAAVSGRQSLGPGQSGKAFKELGFDSPMSSQLRNRLAAATGLSPATSAVFDHPTPVALARHLTELAGESTSDEAEIAPTVDTSDPVVIVGMACRLPGDVRSPEDLWRLLMDEGDAISGFPTDRGWRVEDLYDPDGTRAGTSYVRHGGFLHDATEFDPAFFGINPREAAAMDPQQRLLLETSWECLEHAGIDPAVLRGSRTGVFTGLISQEYGPRLTEGIAGAEGYLLTGTTPSVASGRIAYALGLEGPAVTVDTACSASLFALHLACQAVRLGECDQALAGGATVMPAPGMFVELSKQGALSPDGRCKAFSDDADGTGWAEGAGIVLVERLSTARRLGHQVLAVVRGSAVNSDGASNGLTAPNGSAQRKVIKQALASAGLKPADVQVVEAHGTGTKLGDPIEANAILATYGQNRTSPLVLGSLKSSVGHTQAAAGVAGVIKMVLALRNGIVPRTLHVTTPTSRVDWTSGSVQLATSTELWPAIDGPKRAAVSSFGISGTNAHLVLEEAPVEPEVVRADVAETPLVWALSGKTPAALRAQAEELLDHLGEHPELRADDVAHSLATTRSAFTHRAFVVGGDLLYGVRAIAAGEPAPNVVRGVAEIEGGVVFVFPGQGSQWAGMAVELLDSSPVFAEAFAECSEAIESFVDFEVADVLRDPAELERIEVLQPVLFAVMVSLARLWQRFGVEPSAVVGHSQGEIAAAHVAGALSLRDAARLVVLRSKLFADELVGNGAVASVALPADDVRARIGDRLSLAGVNGPTSCTVAGELAALEEFVAGCEADGIRARVVPSTVASHCAQVEPLRERLIELIGTLTPAAGHIPFYSTVSGGLVDTTELTAEYWFTNARQPVDFVGALGSLFADGHRVFVEASPHPVLTVGVQDTAEASDVAVAAVGSLRRGEGGLARFLTSVAEVNAAGVPVTWDFPAAQRVELPTYAFQRQRYWLATGSAGAPAGDHRFLHSKVDLADGGAVWSGQVSLDDDAWLTDHAAMDVVLLPGTAFLEMAAYAGASAGCDVVDELILQAPLPLPAEGSVELQVALGGDRTIAVYARTASDAPWTLHASGSVSEGEPVDVAWSPAGTAVEVSYDSLDRLGYQYGPLFQGLQALWRDGDVLHAEVELPAGDAVDGFRLHPALLDAALHALPLTADKGLRLPFSWSGVRIASTKATTLRVRLTTSGDGAALVATDADGTLVISAESLVLRAPALQSEVQKPLRVRWVNAPEGSGDVADAVVHEIASNGVEDTHRVVAETLRLVQDSLTDDRVVVIATRGAVAARGSEDVRDLAAASVWGLLRSAQSEHPDRFVLVDLDPADTAPVPLHAVLASGEPQLAMRDGRLLVPRLGDESELLDTPAANWMLDVSQRGSLDGLVLREIPEVELAPNEVRVEVRAVGMNFRDALITLDMYPGDGLLGTESAGVVLETGSDVTEFSAGDRVMGLFPRGTGPIAVTDHRLLAPVPSTWSWAQAAGTPVVFLTAYYALVELAELRRGESLLLHAATGGVGMAALQLARHLGAEVFATAGPAKHDVLRALGVSDDHIASSRDLAFAEQFGQVDVVLNSLTREFIDASIGLLRDGGRFVEMGKNDLRDEVRPDVRYQAFDLLVLDPAHIQGLFAALVPLFEQGVLTPLPVTAWEIREARAALRHLSQARHIGKVVLTLPRKLNPEGTVLITGGTGTLGAQVARRLVERHGVRHLLLLSRSGSDVPELDASVTVVRCDASDRAALEAVLADIPAEHPLTAVVHAAGVLDDATVEAMTEDQVRTVLTPKADAAWHLHELTAGLDLAEFALFSSAAGTIGTGGQANYAAANAFLDALAEQRHAAGLSATSMAWGYWAESSGMSGHLTSEDLGRLGRSGVLPLSTEDGLALFDRDFLGAAAVTVPARIDRSGAGVVPAVLRSLVKARTARVARELPLAQRLAGLTGAEQHRVLLDLVCTNAAVVLGHADASGFSVTQAFKDHGFDSLTAVEMRNRLVAATGLKLPSTLLFDHPTPEQLARGLRSKLVADEPAKPVVVPKPVVTGEREPIAVVGVACRFPGADDVDGFWDLLRNGRDAVRPVPEQRWDPAEFAGTAPGRTVPVEGGFLDRPVDEFDPLFFGISPREAQEMDPQQRLFLEVAWEALEDAGLAGATLAGSRTGVFASAIWQDYAGLAPDVDQFSLHSATGRALNMVANRLSYVLGLRGPSLMVDSACSSSLLAIHLACQSLWSGESTAAIAGGSSLILNPATMVALTQFGGLAPDGRCKAFDGSADGFGRGEGCGVVVLKPLSRAIADGDDIWCTIRGSASNNDGLSNGLTAPSVTAQEDVLREAYRRSGVEPHDVHYVETHGTGTSLGDPIEASALGAVVGGERDDALVIGSVKSNIGHLEAAAGVAGFIKAVLVLRNRAVPPNLHFATPNPEIDFDGLGLRVPTELEQWPAERAPFAAVSAFGWGGTNVHVVLEGSESTTVEAPDEQHLESQTEQGSHLVVLSAKTPEALQAHAAQVATVDLPVREVAAAASARMAQPHRLAVVTGDSAELAEALAAHGRGETHVGVATGTAEAPPKIAFVFPGQGSQWIGMGRELLGAEPVFRAALEECDAAVREFADWSVIAELEADEETSQLHRIDVVQPMLFAVEVALAALWRSWGVEPDAVVGHSMGEIAAAHVAGVLTIEDAARIICLRSALLRRVAGQGAMLAAELTLDEAAETVAGHEAEVSIGVNNSPRSTVLSGDPEALELIKTRLEADEVFCRWVKVDVASHSPQMDPLRDDLYAAVAAVRPRKATVPVYSTVRGEVLDGTTMDADYWVDNLRAPVLFAGMISALAKDGVQAFVEMTPHPILVPAVEQNVPGTAALPSLRRNEPERPSLLRTLGRLHVLGLPVQGSPAIAAADRRVKLPSYPWQRERFWHPSETRRVTRTRAAGEHPLLGERLDSAVEPGTRYWQWDVDADTAAVRDHRVGGVAIVPGALYVDVLLAAAAEIRPGEKFDITGLVFAEPLVVREGVQHRMQLVLTVDLTARFFAITEGGPLELAHAGLAPREEDTAPDTAVLGGNTETLKGAEFYQVLGERDVRYGPAYQGVVEVEFSTTEALATIELPAAAEDPGHLVHPSYLDSALQVAIPPVLAALGDDRSALVSTSLERISVHKRYLGTGTVHASVLRDGEVFLADVRLLDPDGDTVVEATGLRMALVDNGSGVTSTQEPLAEIKALAPAERGEAVQNLVATTVSGVVGLPAERIGRDQPLRGFGIDSVMSMELRNRLEAAFGVRLSATLIWNYPTVHELARFLADLAGLAPEAEAVPIEEIVLDAPAHESDDLVERELAELLQRMENI